MATARPQLNTVKAKRNSLIAGCSRRRLSSSTEDPGKSQQRYRQARDCVSRGAVPSSPEANVNTVIPCGERQKYLGGRWKRGDAGRFRVYLNFPRRIIYQA